MNTDPKPQRPLGEVATQAVRLLYRELGPTDATRFLHLLRPPSGDYSEERKRTFAGLSLADIVAAIRAEQDHLRPPGDP